MDGDGQRGALTSAGVGRGAAAPDEVEVEGGGVALVGRMEASVVGSALATSEEVGHSLIE